MTENLSAKSYLTIKPIGFGEIERIKFESLLTIAENMLNFSWKLTEATESDFYLLPGHLKLLMDKDDLLKSLPHRRCIFYTEKITNDTQYHEILANKENIPHLRSLVELLNTLSSSISSIELENLVPAEENDLKSPVTKNLTESEYFDPNDGFLGHLLSDNDSIKEYKLLDQTLIAKLYIDRGNNIYYCQASLENLEAFFATDANILKRDISKQQLQEIISTEEIKPKPLNNLLWHGAFISSQGRLMTGHNAKTDIIHLKRWPDINLPGSRKLIKLAAYMQSNSVDLNTIQQQTDIPIEQVHNFFNACKIIDLIEYRQTTDIHEKNLDNNQRQLYEKIAKRLN